MVRKIVVIAIVFEHLKFVEQVVFVNHLHLIIVECHLVVVFVKPHLNYPKFVVVAELLLRLYQNLELVLNQLVLILLSLVLRRLHLLYHLQKLLPLLLVQLKHFVLVELVYLFHL